MEFAELLKSLRGCRLAEDKSGVIRNGYLPDRELQTGPVTVRIPPATEPSQ